MPKERRNDEMLIRIEERLVSLNREITENIKPSVGKIENYNMIQNGHVRDLLERCASTTERSKTNYKLCCIAIAIGIGALSTGLSISHILGIIP